MIFPAMSLRIFNYPLPILVVSLLFISIPILNFLFTAALYDLSQQNWDHVLDRIQPLQYTLSALSIVIAYGLLTKKKFGYYLFLIFAIILASYNIWMITWISLGKKLFLAGVRLQTPEILGNAIFTSFILGTIFYFLRREVSAPYLSSLDRGWRGGYRETHPVPFHWESETRKSEGDGFTINISDSGALIPLIEGHMLVEGDILNTKFNVENEKRETISIAFQGEVVRLEREEDGSETAGIRFQLASVSKDLKEEFNKFLVRVFAPRYPVKNEIKAGRKEANESSGELVNVSTEGCYIKSEIVYPMNESIRLKIVTRSGMIFLNGIVRWSNPNARYGKPKGYGLQIESVDNPTQFKMWVWRQKFRIFHAR
jgi:hypothetical protein